MRRTLFSIGVAAAFFVCFVLPAKATPTSIDVSLGNTAPGFSPGTKITPAQYNSAASGQPAPFNAPCGSDASSNCSASWTFNYPVPSGPVGSASLSLGIYDIDSAAPGDQIASFTLDGSDDLTGLLNTASEALDGTGSPNSYYDVLTITIPGADLAALGSGSATFALQLTGPGLGALGDTPDNGAGLVFSSLDIGVTPEPTSWLLFLTGIALIGGGLFSRRIIPGRNL